MQHTGPIDFTAEVDAISWPTEDEDIAGVLEALRSPNIPLASADRLIRSLIRIAKSQAYGAGCQRGVRIGETITNQVLKETRAALASPKGSA